MAWDRKCKEDENFKHNIGRFIERTILNLKHITRYLRLRVRHD